MENGTSLYSEAVLRKNPVGYWRLGERNGPIAFDASSQGHDGTYHGALSFRQKGALHNDPDTAVKFTPPSYIEIPDDSAFSQPTSGDGLTVEAWMRPDALVFAGATDDPYVFWLGKGESGQMEWAFRFYSRESSRPNRVSAYIFNAAGGLGAGAYFQDQLTSGQWMHVVAAFDPGDQSDADAGVSIYRNAELRGGPSTQHGSLYQSFNIQPSHGSAPLRLGTRDSDTFLTGALDEVAIYPRVLSADEILENYQTGIA